MDEEYRPNESDEIRQLRSTAAYKRARANFLAGKPLCAMCEEEGIVTLAEELDHKEPCHGNVGLFWDQSNWQGLCRNCHILKTQEENRTRDSVNQEWIERMKEWDEED